MIRKQLNFSYTEWKKEELSPQNRRVVEAAQQATAKAYAPYSHFQVGAAILLEDGSLITGGNQENASFPAGICAERTALSTLSSIAPEKRIEAIAVSYNNGEKKSAFIISPCGICRQVIAEYEMRQETPIRILLSGPLPETPVLEMTDTTSLLPFAFSKKNMD